MSQTRLYAGKRIGIISAAWHDDLIGVGRAACVARLEQEGITADKIDMVTVPGSLEIPLMALDLARTTRYDCLIAFGLIVNGGIYRHEFVAQSVLDGIMRVQLDSGVPILSAILTPINFHEHQVHHDFFRQHLQHKGEEVANSLLALLAERQRVLG